MNSCISSRWIHAFRPDEFMHIVQMNSCISSIGIHAFWPDKFMHIVQMNSCILARWSHAFRPDDSCISARWIHAFRPEKCMHFVRINSCKFTQWIHAFWPDYLIEFMPFGQMNWLNSGISGRLISAFRPDWFPSDMMCSVWGIQAWWRESILDSSRK